MFTSQFGHKLQEVVRWRCLINLAGASMIESISPMPVIKFAMMEQPEITWKRGCFPRSLSERLARPSTCRWSRHLCPQSDRGWQWGWSFEDYILGNKLREKLQKRCFLRSQPFSLWAFCTSQFSVQSVHGRWWGDFASWGIIWEGLVKLKKPRIYVSFRRRSLSPCTDVEEEE